MYNFDPYNVFLTIATNIPRAPGTHIWIIMWLGLELWCWKYSFDHRNKLQSNTYSHRKHLFYILIIFSHFYCVFDQINAALLSTRDSFVKPITHPDLLVYQLSGHLHLLRRSPDGEDPHVWVGVRRRISLQLHMGSGLLVDALYGLSTWAEHKHMNTTSSVPHTEY